MKKTGTLEIYKEQGKHVFTIDQFSMLEPTVYHIRFRTHPQGEVREAHGLTFACAEINNLPQCPPVCPSCKVNRNHRIPGKARKCDNCGIEWNSL